MYSSHVSSRKPVVHGRIGQLQARFFLPFFLLLLAVLSNAEREETRTCHRDG